MNKINSLVSKGDSVDLNLSKPTMFPGNMFEVNIKATDDTLLNWDKTIGNQNAKVQDATNAVLTSLTDDQLERFITTYGKYPSWSRAIEGGRSQLVFDAKVIADDLKAESFLIGINRLKKNDKLIVEDILAEQGIKGIKYNDGITRNKKGTKKNNYVIFDARIIEISKKYGITIPAAGKLLMEMDSKMKDDTKLQMEKLTE